MISLYKCIVLKDHEDPDVWCSKRSGNAPVLMLDKQHWYVIVWKSILCKTDVNSIGNEQQGQSIEVLVSTHIPSGISLPLCQPVNCIFWLIKTLNWLVVATRRVALLSVLLFIPLYCDGSTSYFLYLRPCWIAPLEQQ